MIQPTPELIAQLKRKTKCLLCGAEFDNPEWSVIPTAQANAERGMQFLAETLGGHLEKQHPEQFQMTQPPAAQYALLLCTSFFLSGDTLLNHGRDALRGATHQSTRKMSVTDERLLDAVKQMFKSGPPSEHAVLKFMKELRDTCEEKGKHAPMFLQFNLSQKNGSLIKPV